MFQGEFLHNLDQKNRVVIPLKFRIFISDQERKGFFLTVTPLKRDEKCIRMYLPTQWAMVTEKIKREAYSSSDLDVVMRSFSARSEFADMDVQNRIVIPQRLIEYADLVKKKPVVLVGCVDHIQIWNQDEWHKVTVQCDEQLGKFGIEMKDIYGI
ncbi:MAG: hypothetical protein HY606_08475 [Planctomycetes bacterium]|nr:hypothetical protein [Planctomycetota bacterium]